MSKILQVAKREVGRFRARFSGRSQPVVLALIVLSLIVSYFVAQQGLVIGKDIYTIGVSPDGPAIGDLRFNVMSLDRATGQKMLADGSIDLYLDGETALTRRDDRSQYAAGALRQYLERPRPRGSSSNTTLTGHSRCALRSATCTRRRYRRPRRPARPRPSRQQLTAPAPRSKRRSRS